jgi:branched-chain amino acid transport system ATP-binding protein
MTNSPDADERPILLEARDIVVHYGRIQALHGVSLVCGRASWRLCWVPTAQAKPPSCGHLGPATADLGPVWFGGEDISRVKAHRRVTNGLTQAPEGRGVFPGMTVTENIEMGCYGRKFASKAEHKERLDWVLERSAFAERKNQVGGTSPAASSRCWRSAALMACPRVLLLDESMGLAPMVISQIFKIIAEINSQAHGPARRTERAAALTRSDRAYILETGEITREGKARELLEDDSIRAAYLGVA